MHVEVPFVELMPGDVITHGHCVHTIEAVVLKAPSYVRTHHASGVPDVIWFGTNARTQVYDPVAFVVARLGLMTMDERRGVQSALTLLIDKADVPQLVEGTGLDPVS